MTRTTNQMTVRQGRWTRPLWRVGCALTLLCGALGAASPSQTTLAATVVNTTSVTLTQSAATTVAGQPVTFTITVTGPTVSDSNGCQIYLSGPIYLFGQQRSIDHPVLLATVTVPPTAPCTLEKGAPNTVTRQITTNAFVKPLVSSVAFPVTAEYAGDTTFQGSYRQVSHVVSGPGKVAVSVSTDFATIRPGVPFMLHVAVRQIAPSTAIPSGTVVVRDISTTAPPLEIGEGTLNAKGQVSVPIELQTSDSIQATYEGDAHYPATSSTMSMNVTP